MRVNCIICGKRIFRSKNQSRTRERRSSRAVTCSRLCSKKYTNERIQRKKKK